ncbi:IclR family transcriptional regulator [Sciscionella marina]|uniref:IclR family transcriptional regulator n=1 Tax=Sciscionella marina TaxID=508770 RepID=UPI000477032B|nr:IclR family transcriptional regulator [Sciscionella marina]
MSNPTERRGSSTAVQSVDRAITVLEFLAKQGEAGITEIAGELDVHKSTASRLVSVLQARGLVEQLGSRGKYAIGIGIVRLAGAASNRTDIASLSQPVCEQLAEELGETVNVAILNDDGVAVNIAQSRSTSAVATQNWIGQRTALHATSSGKVLLAHLPLARRRALLRRRLEDFTPKTITDGAELSTELDSIVRDGYSWCFEELELGMHAVAVPVRGDHGDVVAALSASGPAYRLTRERIRQVSVEIIRAAGELSANLGYWD